MLNPKMSVRDIQRKHKKEFAGWFKDCIRTSLKAKHSIPAELGVIAEDDNINLVRDDVSGGYADGVPPTYAAETDT
ncbi:hypothetical protein BVC80_1279g3 [Macleaya cordata]|uniref:Uncharacterized protein n=1 Tax=Macleaya cordata TaxID=56857 RepID=A0A200PZK8_MACCD|nr:hypothetical protein BVC80_1279g3 [Macleaya cordata]